MKMKKGAVLRIFVLLFFLAGCAGVQGFTSNPTISSSRNDYFEVQLEPQMPEGKNYFNAFRFVFTNRTGKDLIVDWSKTYYILNGRRQGQFGWEGMSFEQLRGIRSQPLLTVSAGNTHSNVIFPLRLIAWDMRGRESIPRKRPEEAFFPGVIPAGENGILLSVTHEGKVIREKVTLDIKQ
jgi:hypothetical protein